MPQVTVVNPVLDDYQHETVVPMDITILDLKQRLAVDYPGQPPASQQRLIYDGTLMLDTICLKSILTPEV